MTVESLAKALAAGLPGVERRRYRCDDEGLGLARDQRAVSVLAAARSAGRLELTDPDQAPALVAAHEAAMVQCLVLERALLDVVERLERAGVETRVLKGPAVAHLDYPDPAWRTFGDVDLLVRSERYDAAVRTLEEWGARRRSAEVRPGFDRRFGKGVCMFGPGGVQVDVHRTLATGPFGVTSRMDRCFASADALDIGGVTLAALTRPLRFLHACQHAVLGDWPPRLVPLRDVAQLRPADDAALEIVLDIARDWRSTAVVADAVLTAERMLDLPRDFVGEWAARHVASRFERRALAAYQGPQRSYARQMAAAFPAVPGVGGKLAFARALLVPGRDYVGRHDGTYWHRMRRAMHVTGRAS
ncbi:MAG: nucleotidyltransferase family protein [Acidimicrobiia bacterium]